MDRKRYPELTARFAADLFRLWPEGEGGDARLGLAVSGGGDSLSLLLLAADAMPGRVAAATVDHRLRPESAGEAAMVARLCGSLGVPHETLTVTLEPGNVQDRARAARYEALGSWCRRGGLGALATAHQLDDQAETLVMRLNRGSGLAGLAGVRARAGLTHADLPVLRPLLGWRRAELAAVTAGAGIEAAADPSNEDSRFDRVRTRNALAGADWLDPVMLARSAAMLGEAESYVAQRIDAVFEQCVVLTEGQARFSPDRSDFEAGELAGRIIARFGGTVARSDVAALVARLRRGDNASLGGLLAHVAGGDWVFAPEPPRRA